MATFYCGNKDIHPHTFTRLGNRYECFKKGVGLGLHLPPSKSKKRFCLVYNKKKSKIFCGTKINLPQGYKKFGTRYECLRKGVGVGKFVIPNIKNKKLIISLCLFLCLLLITCGLTLIILTSQLNNTFEKTDDTNKQIQILKIISYIISSLILLCSLLILITNNTICLSVSILLLLCCITLFIITSLKITSNKHIQILKITFYLVGSIFLFCVFLIFLQCNIL